MRSYHFRFYCLPPRSLGCSNPGHHHGSYVGSIRAAADEPLVRTIMQIPPLTRSSQRADFAFGVCTPICSSLLGTLLFLLFFDVLCIYVLLFLGWDVTTIRQSTGTVMMNGCSQSIYQKLNPKKKRNCAVGLGRGGAGSCFTISGLLNVIVTHLRIHFGGNNAIFHPMGYCINMPID